MGVPGEKLLFQPMTNNVAANKFGARWHYGAFLGINLRRGEIIIGQVDGASVQAWSICRVPEVERWDVDVVLRVHDWPKGELVGLHVSVEEFPTVEGPSARPGAPLSFPVRLKDIVQFGYAMGCTGCRIAKIQGTQQTNEPRCREHIMNDPMKTVAGQALVGEDESQDEHRKAKRLYGSADFEGRTPPRPVCPPEVDANAPTPQACGTGCGWVEGPASARPMPLRGTGPEGQRRFGRCVPLRGQRQPERPAQV